MQADRQAVKRERELGGSGGGGRGSIDQGWQERRVRKEGKGWEKAAKGEGIRGWGGGSPGGDGEREGKCCLPRSRRATQIQPKGHSQKSPLETKIRAARRQQEPWLLTASRQGDVGPLCVARRSPHPPFCSAKPFPSSPHLVALHNLLFFGGKIQVPAVRATKRPHQDVRVRVPIGAQWSPQRYPLPPQP